jgi:lysophospholipase L1-like esterase
MSTFNNGFIQSGDGNLAESVHVGRPGQQVVFSNVTPAESYLALYPTIESVPDDFNGTVDIVTPTYRATVKGDGATKYTVGSGPIADRPSAADFGVGTWQDGLNRYTCNGVNYFPVKNKNFPTLKWDAAKAKASSGFGNAKVVFIGDSTTAGAFAYNPADYINAAPFGVPGRVAALMTANGAPSSVGNTFGAHGLATAALLLEYDTRMVFGAGWSQFSGIRSLGGEIISNASASLTTFSFTPIATFDTIDIYYVASNGYGTFTADIGAGALATVNANNGGTPVVTKLSLTVAAGTHTVNINKTVAGNIFIVGISTYKNNNEVQVINLGEAGIRADNYLGAGNYAHAPALAVLQPNLSVINLGINDCRDVTPNITLYTSKMQSIINTCKLYGDVVLATPNPISGAPNSESYYAVIRELAITNSLNLLDYSIEMGTDWSVPNAAGLMGDTLHPKQAGYMVEANIAKNSGIII